MKDTILSKKKKPIAETPQFWTKDGSKEPIDFFWDYYKKIEIEWLVKGNSPAELRVSDWLKKAETFAEFVEGLRGMEEFVSKPHTNNKYFFGLDVMEMQRIEADFNHDWHIEQNELK